MLQPIPSANQRTQRNWPNILLLLYVVLAFFLLIGVRHENLNLNKLIDRHKQERDQLAKEGNELATELHRLTQPERVEKMAREMGLDVAKNHQTMWVMPRPFHGLSVSDRAASETLGGQSTAVSLTSVQATTNGTQKKAAAKSIAPRAGLVSVERERD